jgi:hypothetical protein
MYLALVYKSVELFNVKGYVLLSATQVKLKVASVTLRMPRTRNEACPAMGDIAHRRRRPICIEPRALRENIVDTVLANDLLPTSISKVLMFQGQPVVHPYEGESLYLYS